MARSRPEVRGRPGRSGGSSGQAVDPRWAVAVLAGALLVALLPATGGAADPPARSDPKVEQEVAGGATTTFFVVLKEKARTREGARGLRGHARTRVVVAALKSTAEHPQAGALTKLREEQTNRACSGLHAPVGTGRNHRDR